jgi:hypothetical protein
MKERVERHLESINTAFFFAWFINQPLRIMDCDLDVNGSKNA